MGKLNIIKVPCQRCFLGRVNYTQSAGTFFGRGYPKCLSFPSPLAPSCMKRQQSWSVSVVGSRWLVVNHRFTSNRSVNMRRNAASNVVRLSLGEDKRECLPNKSEGFPCPFTKKPDTYGAATVLLLTVNSKPNNSWSVLLLPLSDLQSLRTCWLIYQHVQHKFSCLAQWLTI